VEVLEYELPPSAIAQRPVEPRSAARLLVSLDPCRPPRHLTVADLPDLLAAGDLLVVNETKVLPARLHLRKRTGGAVEVLLLEQGADPAEWEALVRPSRRVPPGTELVAGPVAGTDVGTNEILVVVVGEALAGGRRSVRVVGDIEAHGVLPLPPYIHEPLADPARYQTVYAAVPGSVAAPTAGLHLTDEVLERCRAREIGVATVDLAVGLDTFRPIEVDDADRHPMHSERYSVPAATWAACEATRRRGGRVVAVGTTTVRSLEAAAATGTLQGRTDLFIRGDYRFKVVDVLLTNFHMPRSSLLLLIDAFTAGRWRGLYTTALDEGYRFLSFGDAMLVAR
jgi:S-adenosylmethionine:tRNA ribosyltransferase-isomerase